MPTFSSTPTEKIRRAAGEAPGRLARATPTPRLSAPVHVLRRRLQPEPSRFEKVLSVVLPAAAAKKVASSPKRIKAGGLALVATAAAAGVAFKNRGRLSELRGKDSDHDFSGSVNSATPPATPIA